MNKINAAYSFGGVPLVARTLEQLIGARTDHVAIVDFEGFKGITEALGGVTFTNPVEFSPAAGSPTPDAHFAKGTITITDGDVALSYVRERKAFTDGDYQRVRNQQAFLRGVIDGILSKETLANPVRVQQLVQALGGYVVTDSGLDVGTILSLATSLFGLKGSDIRMFTLPTLGTGMEGSQSVVYVDEAQLATLKPAWSTDSLAGYEPPKP